ncbi:efflux RND transporter permease subunit [Alkalicoccobacillus porphyridii]|uniref:Efflux RND transporter permease subunit n=1 Tax=Alkalicoccobacillus porphyridii TaxID=2597270 RepID=A0A554A3Q9_9BACI|nr:efflux RND transporter permease subunit [Alkalicoccobacillus porphyridii]TSB48320.1 efflux RND transporter permease subunit [Alkalicoccobacillus porphyridii]
MKKIIEFSLKNKFALWLLTIMVVAAGLYSGLNMKMETIPNINTPIITITTTYPGATPEEVLDKVTEPIEQKVEGLNGVANVTSSSFQNASSIQIEYRFSKDMDEALTEVKDVLDGESFPEGVSDPSISRLSLSAFPVLTLSASSEESLTDLTDLVENEVAPALEGLDGVSSVSLSGQTVKEVQLQFNEEELAENGLDEETVLQIIQGSDIRFPLGLYTFGDKEQSVVIDGDVHTVEDLEAILIPVSLGGSPEVMPGAEEMVPGGEIDPETPVGSELPASFDIPTVTLGELANIEVVNESQSISRTNGKDAIGIQIVSNADANTVDVVDRAMETASELEEKHSGLEIVSTLDLGEPIKESVETMISKALFGALFAMIIILLFLRNFKTTLISVISIPLSLLIAILLLNQMDITLNVMTLGAMTVAIGRVIDDSIVVIENIFRRMGMASEPLKGKALIVDATKEMFMPILSSTIVTISVFLPLGLVEGMVGELFLPFALTVVFALLASLLVAITIVPMMAHSMFKKGLSQANQSHAEKPSKLANAYKRILNWSLDHKWITSLVAIALLVGSLFLVPAVGVSFLPADEEKAMYVTFNPEPGQTTDEVEELAGQAETLLEEREGIELIQLSIGGENPLSMGPSNSSIFYIQYADDFVGFAAEKDEVMDQLTALSDKGTWANQDFSEMSGASSELSVQVSGPSLEVIQPVVTEVEQLLAAQEDLSDVETSLSEQYEEYNLVADAEELSRNGLTAAQVGMTLSNYGQREVLTTINEEGAELDVFVEKEEESYASIEELLDRTILTALGEEVEIRDLVTIEEGTTPDTITRRNGEIYADASGNITSNDVGAVSSAVQAELDELDLPSGVDVSMGGVSADIEESFTQLGLAMLAAIAIVYFVLVLTFGGGLAPFAILFSLPFTVIGALVALLIAGETISVSSMIGALMLIGIVVTNAIVLIDRVIHQENEGLSTREALLEAGSTRLRPILMTALATIGALLPLAFGFEGGGLISKGLGVTVIGGLTSSTLLTLLIVPLVYELLMKMKKRAVKE